ARSAAAGSVAGGSGCCAWPFSVSQYAPLYQQLPAAIAAHLFNGVQVPPIVPPRFGDAGGARGAALLACQPSFS
ncbi:hypothetical protein ACEN9Z_12490, partial [Stenotrophomonas geniculata]